MRRWLASLALRQRLLIILIALDHFALAILTLGNCRRGETLSASAWRQEQAGRIQGRIARPVIDWMSSWAERDHCQASWLAEQQMYRAQP